MELSIGCITHKFIPNIVVSFPKIHKIRTILDNDSFKKYTAIAEIKGEYIICNDNSKLKNNTNCIRKETYEEYLEFIKNRSFEKDKWIYNIIDGIAEQDNILYKDNLAIVIPAYTWDSENINKLHILCIPIDKNIRSIRDLTIENVPLLEHMKKIALENIEEKYEIKEEHLKIFLHYDPSTYHLHIHFVNTEFKDCCSSIEYSHDLDTIVFNLKLDSDYYKKIKLNKRV